MAYKNQTAVNVFCGMELLDTLFCIFLVLKLLGKITWSWWWVTAPLWAQPLIAILEILITLIVIRINLKRNR